MSSKPDLVVDWCDYKAAKYAVEHWHYSETMPSAYARLAKIGVWEGGGFIGSVIFSHGSNRNIGAPYGLTIYAACELVRVALTYHVAPVSKIVKCAIGLLKAQSPGLRLVVSYADPVQGHHGGIYQSLSWLYAGVSPRSNQYILNGKIWHKKALWATYGTNRVDILGADIVTIPGKHKYLYPLDRAMRRQIAPLAQPYPKREDMRPADGSAEGDQLPVGGSTPTRTL